MIANGEIGPVLHIESDRLSVREPRPYRRHRRTCYPDMDICRI